MTKIRIVAVVVDTQQLTLYKDDGNTVSILQGDPRVRSIVDQVLPIVETGGVAEVDLEFPNQYKEFEQQSGGLVRLFRTTKKAVAHIFGAKAGDAIPEGDFGAVPASVKKSRAQAVEEIIANAQPVSAEGYAQSDTGPADTMIAVVGSGKQATIIPGVEALADQFAHSARNRNTIGVQNLLKRMAGYIAKRAHSVEDLLRFLERGDLPIADDGSIIAYKRLYRVDGKPGYYVDPHSRLVEQRVGSYICVSEDQVDKNRRNECSNGLHIGRRGYMGSFNGNVIVLCKIDPEDVIVVPHNDPNKVRVCGYHIIAELTQAQFDAICRNKPMTEQSGAQLLLGQALAGKHIARVEEVRITGQRGQGVVTTPLLKGKAARPALPAGPAPKATALDDKVNDQSSKADPKEVAAQVTAIKSGNNRMARAQELLRIIKTSLDAATRWQAATDLAAFKRSSKVSWMTLGVIQTDVAEVLKIAATDKPRPVSTFATVKKSKKKVPAKRKTATKAPGKPKETVTKTEAGKVTATSTLTSSKPLSKLEQVRIWRDQLDSNHLSDAQHAVIARQMLDSRRAWKKSWAALGLPATTDDELKAIVNASPVNVPHKVPSAGAKIVEALEEAVEVAKGSKTAKTTKVKVKKDKSTTSLIPKVPPTKSNPLGMTRADRARGYFLANDWPGLLGFKKASKLGWTALGFTSLEIDEIKLHIGD